jgi:hypothetical protein
MAINSKIRSPRQWPSKAKQVLLAIVNGEKAPRLARRFKLAHLSLSNTR